MLRSYRITGSVLAFFILTALSMGVFAQSSENFWKPIADEVYLQEVSKKIPFDQPISSIGVWKDQVFAVVGPQIYSLNNDQLELAKKAPQNVNRLISLNGELWALTGDGLSRYTGKSWEKVSDLLIVDLCTHLGALHAATVEDIYRLEGNMLVSIKPEGGYLNSDITTLMEDGTQVHTDPVRLGPISRIDSYSGTLHVLRRNELVQFDGHIVNTDFIDWGHLPYGKTNDLLSFGSKLYISTDKGLGELRGANLEVIKGEDGLPVENTTALTRGFDNDLWVGTARGAVRKIGDEWHYFGADHWLPNNKVNEITVSGKQVYLTTDGGIGVISYEPYTLQKKANYYERHIHEWGHKRLGFIQSLNKSDGEWIRSVSDNDGAHTATYLAAMTFKYKVTGDETARQEAIDALKALVWLERITPIDGFFARAIYSKDGDKGGLSRHGSGGLPAKWYETKDGKFYWKGDTSSDEVIAHFYAVSLFHDLIAEGEEKELAKEHLVRIARYIMENNWVLIDMDGKPTRWGRWNPEYLLRPYGYNDRGVNGLEALAFTQAAYKLSGDEDFKEGFEELVDLGYLTNTLRQKNTFPPSTLAPWDDNLAFEAYNTILRYTDDPETRSFLLRSLERTYEIKRMEHVPWFNYTYGAYTNNDFDNEQCVKHLRAWTLDCVVHKFHNSHRDDLYVEEGYKSYEGGVKAISPRESAVMRGSRPATVLDGGSGAQVMEPTGFLRDYWMGRYYGFIKAPTTTEEDLLTLESRRGQFGAAPYKGPGRPEF